MIDQIFRIAQLPAKPLQYVARCIYLFHLKSSVDTYPLWNWALSNNIECWLQLVRKWGRGEKAIFAKSFEKDLWVFFSFSVSKSILFFSVNFHPPPPSKNVCAHPTFYSWSSLPAPDCEVTSQHKTYMRHPTDQRGCRNRRTPKETCCPSPLLG